MTNYLVLSKTFHYLSEQMEIFYCKINKINKKLYRVKDSSKHYRDPTEEEQSYFCKPLMNTENTELVIVDENKKSQDQQENGGSGLVKNLINLYNNSSDNPVTRRMNNARLGGYKEKGIVIKVKKNQTQEEVTTTTSEKDEKTITENGGNNLSNINDNEEGIDDNFHKNLENGQKENKNESGNGNTNNKTVNTVNGNSSEYEKMLAATYCNDYEDDDFAPII
jgi:hypothetical protein